MKYLTFDTYGEMDLRNRKFITDRGWPEGVTIKLGPEYKLVDGRWAIALKDNSGLTEDEIASLEDEIEVMDLWDS